MKVEGSPLSDTTLLVDSSAKAGPELERQAGSDIERSSDRSASQSHLLRSFNSTAAASPSFSSVRQPNPDFATPRSSSGVGQVESHTIRTMSALHSPPPPPPGGDHAFRLPPISALRDKAEHLSSYHLSSYGPRHDQHRLGSPTYSPYMFEEAGAEDRRDRILHGHDSGGTARGLYGERGVDQKRMRWSGSAGAVGDDVNDGEVRAHSDTDLQIDSALAQARDARAKVASPLAAAAAPSSEMEHRFEDSERSGIRSHSQRHPLPHDAAVFAANTSHRSPLTDASGPFGAVDSAQSTSLRSLDASQSGVLHSPDLVGRHVSRSPTDRSKLPPFSMMQHAPPRHASFGSSNDRMAERVSSMSDAPPPPPSHHPSPPSSAPATSSVHAPTRATSFMASLLRAAQSPGPQSPSVHSPMSVHSIVEPSRAPSPRMERRPRKRRTSSVQEPLQASALEAAARAQSFPRLSESATYRGHAVDDSMSRLHMSTSLPIRGASVGLSQSPSEAWSPGIAADPRPSRGMHQWRPDSRSPAEHAGLPYGGHSGYAPTYRHEQHHIAMPLHRAPSGSPYSPRGSHGHTASHNLHSPQTSHGSAHGWGSTAAGQGGYGRSTPSVGMGGHYPLSGVSVSASRPNGTGKIGGSGVAFESIHWNSELASRTMAEHDRWARTPLSERRQQVTQSIWDARPSLRKALTYWPPAPSNVTTIRCMYANIAQKSYGSEKRFLCPPPVVKINGPLRPCKWVSMRVISGDSPTPSVGVAGAPGMGRAMAGGEEPAMLDAQGEARFGKLHVGSISDTASKVFRLQVNLLRAETAGDDAKGGLRAFQDIAGPLQLPSNAWSTFHSSPINVISKPARKSVRTRAASPAIASGSIVCLYNRLNSQTVRTKYLGVETGTIEDVAQVEVARKLVARQDGWEGFSIELLARPLNDPAVARANSRGLPSDDWGITYGSIVCLRDVNSKLCSDPMLICKVDKGRVELSSVVGSAAQEGKVRFQITSKNREEARQILYGGAREKKSSDSTSRPTGSMPSLAQLSAGNKERRDAGSDGSSTGSPPHGLANQHGTSVGLPALDANSMVGGPVIQMQKVTLMHVTPLPSSHAQDEVECELFAPRAYLCSTVSENVREEPSQPALARSQARLQSRSGAVHKGATHISLDEPHPPVNATPISASMQASTLSPFAEAAQALQAQASPIGFTRPPAVLYDVAGSVGQVDVLEDQFCWTIVTISCTEVSYVEANVLKETRSTYPHLPNSPLPVTPYPCLAAQPSYDARSHSLAATIHDYLYAEGLDHARALLNTVSAVHAVPSKVAHEVWLGHSGPLAAHASSAGPHMSDVTVNLPSMEQLMALNEEFNGGSSRADRGPNERAPPSIIRLPILFVRVAQGLTFPSGHWLVAERHASEAALRNARDPLAWSFRIV